MVSPIFIWVFDCHKELDEDFSLAVPHSVDRGAVEGAEEKVVSSARVISYLLTGHEDTAAHKHAGAITLRGDLQREEVRVGAIPRIRNRSYAVSEGLLVVLQNPNQLYHAALVNHSLVIVRNLNGCH